MATGKTIGGKFGALILSMACLSAGIAWGRHVPVDLLAPLELQQGSGNDSFSRAEEVSGESTQVYGTNRGAAVVAGEFLNTEYESAHTVWFKWTAPSNGMLRLEITNADFDTVMGVFTGSSANSLKTVAHDDDGGEDCLSAVVLDVASGTTYYIAIGGFGDGQGDFSMDLDFLSETGLVAVVLDANGGELGTESVRRKPGMEIGALPEPTRDDCRFGGWFTAADGGERVDKYWTVPNDGATLYAHWTKPLHWCKSKSSALAKAKRAGKLIFFLCGRETCSNTTGTRDFSCEDPEVCGALDEYVLWFCNCDTQTQDFLPYANGLRSFSLPLVCVINPFNSSTYIVRSQGYLNAGGILALLRKAGPKMVTFDANGGEVGEHERKVLPQSAIGKLPTPKRGKYTFLGWYTKRSGGTKITVSTKVKADVTYYAHWAAPWTVTWNANGGELGEGVTNKVLVARNKAVGSLPSPTKLGYVFKGWYTKKSGGTKATAKTKVTKNVTYYARWAARKYPVKVVELGTGTVSGAGSKAYKSTVTLKAKAASGYVFQGWYDANEKWRMENGELPNDGLGQLVSQNATYSFRVPLDGVTYTAKFITKAEDMAGIGMAFGGVGFGAMEEPDAASASLSVITNVCGVVTEWPVAATGLTPVSVSVTGQPKGMKYDGKKKAIAGVPSVANKSGTMKITVKSRGAGQTWSVKWSVVELPAFARGTFNGGTYERGEGEASPKRKVTVSVTGEGKITAKVGTLSLARTGWTMGEDGFCRATLAATRTVGTGKKAKMYKDVMTLVLDPGANWTEDQLTGTFKTFLTADLSTPTNADAEFAARRNPFADNDEAKAVAAQLNATGAKTVMDESGLGWDVKVAANGVATISRTTGTGKNRKVVSATAVVEVAYGDGDGYLSVARFFVDGKVIVVPLP